MSEENELTDDQLKELKRDLTTLKAELEEALSLSHESAKPVELDQPIGRLSRMDAIQHQQMAKASRKMQKKRLELVKRAERAIESEEYGECQVCGEWIGFKRLKVKPESHLCLECQSSREQN